MTLNDGRAATRRELLKVVGASASVGGTASAQDGQEVDVHFEFVGVIDGWQGVSPESIGGETNPTLALEPGTTYRVTWENADGALHDFTIRDADENGLQGTEVTDQQGARRSFTFTASEEMDHYVCTIHPDTMRGGLSIGGDGPGAGGGLLRPGPERTVGAVVAVTVGSAAALAYGLATHFDERYEP